MPINSTHRDLHRPYNKNDLMATERFDKLIENISQSIKAKYQAINEVKSNKPTQALNPTPKNKVILNKCVIDQMLNPWTGMLKTVK